MIGFAMTTNILLAEEKVELKPNAILKFEFPELPETFATMVTGNSKPAMLTAQLPSNYSTKGKFPVFVFLNGSEGGRGDSVATARIIIGDKDFICVSMPLFKLDTAEVSDNTKPLSDLVKSYMKEVKPEMDEMIKTAVSDYSKRIIMPADFKPLSEAYDAMLKKLFETVPNTTVERSAIGGFSNGAHATGVLLAGQDKFLMEHFQSFFLWEGGIFVPKEMFGKPVMKPLRLILIYGDQPVDDPARLMYMNIAGAMEQEARKQKLDFTSLVMKGHGHDMPDQYSKILAKWIKGNQVN